MTAPTAPAPVSPPAPPAPSTPPTFHHRALPAHMPALQSVAGRAHFRAALAQGNAEAFFPLSAHFHTQADPGWCALGTLVTALNALEIDPGRVWKGPWRYYGEELLDCCKPLDEAKREGLNLAELACLAHCNGAEGMPVYAAEAALADLRADLRAAVRAPEGEVLIVNYGRKAMQQTGEGHYSPVGAYDEDSDMVLILDVARFKYPPHWAPLTQLFDALRAPDPLTGASRGWLRLRPAAQGEPATRCGA